VTESSALTAAFEVHLDVFEGPFDLLLGLIAKHKLDVTEVALSQVTDEFIGFIRARGSDWDLGQASEFSLLIAYVAVAGALISERASVLIQATTIITLLVSSYIVVLNYPTPIAISDRLRRD